RHRLAVHGRDRYRSPGQVRRGDPRRPAQGPQDGPGRHQLHPEVACSGCRAFASGAPSRLPQQCTAKPPGRQPDKTHEKGDRTTIQTDVVVTGLGATAPLGGDVATTWSALLDGRSGVSVLPEEWHESLPVHFAGQIAQEPSEKLPRPRLRRLDRTQQFALIAAQEAWDDAGTPEVDPLRL